jgi:hypothetical protein
MALARKVDILSSWSAPRHPRAPSLTLEDIRLSPRAFPIQRFTAEPPVVRGYIAKNDLQPPFNITPITAVGWVNGYRDGLVHRQLTKREIFVEAGCETISKVLPVEATFLSFAAGRAGAVIMRQGDPADYFYVIARGKVEVVNHQPRAARLLAAGLAASGAAGHQRYRRG